MKSAVVILALLSLLMNTGVDGQVCSSTAFATGVDIDTSGVSWGDGSACSGHLIAEDANEPLCGFIDHRAAARACWELDIHTSTFSGEKQRRYRCAPYTGGSATALVVGDSYYDLDGGGTIGQMCESGDPDCFMDCHANGGTASTVYAVGTNCGGNTDQTAITCTDVDECTDGIYYDCTGPFQEDCNHRSVVCGPNSDCTDTVGSYMCTCDPGYEAGDAFDPDVGCVDTDECDTANICGSDAVCENTPGSFICVCDAGYTWNDMPSPGTCDINTCPSLSSIPNAVLTPGSNDYGDSSSYDCDSGYEPSIAGSNSFSVQCRDDGSYCACSAPTCERIKCGLPVSDPNARTPVTSKGFESTLTYTCLTGFKAGGAASYSVDCQANGNWENPSNTCHDVNECYDLAQPCPTHSTCFNTIGSHLCVCDPGYEGDNCIEISCGDIPVVANTQITTSVSRADGIFGMIVNYRCEAGYHVSFDHDPNSVLTNFDLECKQDECWSPQPIPQCVPVSCGDPGVVPHSKRSPGNFYFGDEISYTCVEGFRPSDYEAHTQNTYRTFTINCGADGMWSPRPYCTDVNECLENNDPCGPGEGHICINEIGSYTCSCTAYYRLDQSGQNCVGFPVKPADVTEPCNIYTSLAMCNWGTCQYNEIGKPHCWCDAGYTGAFCDRLIYDKPEQTTLSFILAIVSLGLAFLALIIAVIVAFCFCCGRHRRGPIVNHVDHHIDNTPIYQGTPPLGTRYPGSGFIMALRNKACNTLYSTGQ